MGRSVDGGHKVHGTAREVESGVEVGGFVNSKLAAPKEGAESSAERGTKHDASGRREIERVDNGKEDVVGNGKLGLSPRLSVCAFDAGKNTLEDWFAETSEWGADVGVKSADVSDVAFDRANVAPASDSEPSDEFGCGMAGDREEAAVGRAEAGVEAHEFDEGRLACFVGLACGWGKREP